LRAHWQGTDAATTDVARDLAAQCLRKLPGNKDFRKFDAEIGVGPA
jgi:hypothetical protein